MLASTPVNVTPFPASVVTLLLPLANCKPLGVPVVVAVVSVPVVVAPVPTVLSAPVPVVEPAASATVAATSVPVVTAVEFCSWLIMLTASVALNEPAAELTSVLNAAVVFPPVVTNVAAAAPIALLPVSAVTVVLTTVPRTVVAKLVIG